MEIAILMAAGMGTRMRPLTDVTPKPLVKVHGTSMIETIMKGLERRNVSKIYVVVGYKKEQFAYLAEKYDNVELIENTELKRLTIFLPFMRQEKLWERQTALSVKRICIFRICLFLMQSFHVPAIMAKWFRVFPMTGCLTGMENVLHVSERRDRPL